MTQSDTQEEMLVRAQEWLDWHEQVFEEKNWRKRFGERRVVRRQLRDVNQRFLGETLEHRKQTVRHRL
jgi:hypothetical protein